MTAEDCAALVKRGDPDRWRTAMAAPEAKRDGLMALYAWNLEVARAPWVASEEMIAEIRLQWWIDAVDEIYDGRTPRRHEVVQPLADVIAAVNPPRALFHEMARARLADALPGPHSDRAALDAHINHTSGHLMVLAALHLGAEEAALPVVRDYAFGVGVAGFLRSLAEYGRRGHHPVPDDTDPGGLAADGLEKIERARARRNDVAAVVLPALLPGWLAETRLRMAVARPEAVALEGLEVSEFRARLGLTWTALTGRW